MDPTIVCPKCHTEIKLTESLAAPLLEGARKDFEQRLLDKDSEVEQREASITTREEAVRLAREAVDAEVLAKLQKERQQIATDEARKAKQALAIEMEQKSREISELQGVLEQKDLKLVEAQKAQSDALRKQRELDDATRELELTVEKRVNEGLLVTREQARRDVEGELSMKLAEREQTITSMQKQIEELRRRAEQGSQQLQGEVMELALETLLTGKFSRDSIVPVPKGEHGGDVLQRVTDGFGNHCGTILWESKRTKNWSDGWLSKLREDQRVAKAEVAIIVSQVLPKNVEAFDLIDSVWVIHPRVVVPVATLIRESLVALASARQASDGQQTKMEMVYQYLTGPRFRHRVEAIVEGFTSMQADLERERKVITKQWAKREEQIERVMQATVGMYGDLQGIAGRTLPEIEGLELKALGGGVEGEHES